MRVRVRGVRVSGTVKVMVRVRVSIRVIGVKGGVVWDSSATLPFVSLFPRTLTLTLSLTLTLILIPILTLILTLNLTLTLTPTLTQIQNLRS